MKRPAKPVKLVTLRDGRTITMEQWQRELRIWWQS